MNHLFRSLLAFLLCSVLLAAGFTPATAATGEEGYFAPAPAEMLTPVAKPRAQLGITPLADSGVLKGRGGCQYRQSIENPHTSSGDASVHGYWKRVAGDCPEKSNVDVYLQSYWCDRFGCRWITVSSNSGDVRAGGGRGNRITARKTCATTRTVGWRASVDVDLHGQVDPAGLTYSTIVNLACTPS